MRPSTEKNLQTIELLANAAGPHGVDALIAVHALRQDLKELSVVDYIDNMKLVDIEKFVLERRLKNLVKFKESENNKFNIAAKLGIERSTLDRKIKRHGIKDA